LLKIPENKLKNYKIKSGSTESTDSISISITSKFWRPVRCKAAWKG
jgi:hypothetical protein